MAPTPAGEPLTLAHQPRVEALLRALVLGESAQVLAEPWFANLYLFRAVHQYRLVDGPLPCLSGAAYDGVRHLLPLFPLSQASPRQLTALLGEHACFGPLSQAQIARLSSEDFDCLQVPDEAEYLYHADTFRHYRGGALQPKRNLVRQLLSGHQLRSEPLGDGHLSAALQVLQQWMRDKGKPPGAADEHPCEEALQRRAELGLHGMFHWVDDEPAGFVLAQALAPQVQVMRFSKALNRFKGLYPAMFQHFCQQQPALQWLNFEQDLGLPNFRQSKRSYGPAALLPKYRVRPRVGR